MNTPTEDILDQNKQSQNPTSEAESGRKPLWKKILKIFAWTIGSLVVLLLLLMGVVVWYLNPERLTPLVEKYGSEYLKADVKAGRVELTVWKSFPEIRLDIDSLQLTSRTLQGQPDSVMNALPANASHLLGAAQISGGINPWKLLKGEIALGDISITGADVNLVSYNDKINNFDIIPPSKEEKKKEGKPWKISLHNVRLDAPGGIRYFDASGRMAAVLHSPSLFIQSNSGSLNDLQTSFSTPVSLTLDGTEYLASIPVALSGKVNVNLDPMKVSTTDYSISIATISSLLTATLDFGKAPTLTKCSLAVDPIKIMPLLSLLPEDMQKEMTILKRIDTDASVGLLAEVATPYSLTSDAAPSVHLDFTVPTCHFSLKDEKELEILHLDRIDVGGSFDFDGTRPEMSRLNVPVLNLEGKDVTLAITAMADEVLSKDPRITITSRGEVDLRGFASLIPIPGTILKGKVNADASIKCLLSDLTEMKYENIDADGSVEIRGLLCSLPLLTTEVYSQVAKFRFGNNMTMRDNGRLLTGLLRAEADIDTLYMEVPGISVGLRNANLKAGSTEALLKQKKSKQITPLGMSLSAQRISANSSTDTMSVRADNLQAKGSVTRYEGKSDSPLLKAALSATRLRYADPAMRLRTRNLDAEIVAHLRERDKNKKSAYQRRYDAIAKRHPGLSPDSIAILASRKRELTNDPSVVRIDLDNGIKALFRQWGITGHVNSDRLSMTMLMYPVRTVIKNLGFDFSLDSLRLHRATITSQENSLTVSGEVSNMRQLMLGRVRTPLKVRLNVEADNLDINQIAYNFRLGQGLAAQRGHLAKLSPEEEDAMVQAAANVPVESAAIDTMPLLVPQNIDAVVKMKASKVTYDNINLYDAATSVAMNDGAFSVDSLTASTDFGDAYLNMLYSSRDVNKMNLAIDLGFSKVDLNNLFESFPQIPEMAPMITNLDGMVGARLAGSMEFFPNMDIDIPSLNAMLNISGRDLTLTQDPMIRKIARMMLIRKNGALNISDMDIQIALHDNVLRLYPFTFGLEKYRFALLGENDLSSNMYYHLSVLKSPIPFKFGINIKGTFDKPKFRFGGPKYKENEAREMVNLLEDQRVNFVKAMRMELHKIINKAAFSYRDRPEFNKYNQEEERKNQNYTDDEPYSDPIEMLGSKIKTPVIKAISGKSNVLKAKMEALDKEKSKKNKKKK